MMCMQTNRIYEIAKLLVVYLTIKGIDAVIRHNKQYRTGTCCAIIFNIFSKVYAPYWKRRTSNLTYLNVYLY